MRAKDAKTSKRVCLVRDGRVPQQDTRNSVAVASPVEGATGELGRSRTYTIRAPWCVEPLT
jgi:hypothetical protein